MGCVAVAGLAAASIATGALAQDTIGQPAGEPGKPNPLKNVYFGE